jgi:hypothetical protein
MKNKNVLYFFATLIGLLIVMFFFNDKPQQNPVAETASPLNGMIGGTTAQSAATTAEPAADTPLPGDTQDNDGSDELPVGAEVSGAAPATESIPAPAPADTIPALPPGEGR